MKVIFICKETRLYLPVEIETEPQVGRTVSIRLHRNRSTMNVYEVVDIKYATFVYYERPKQDNEQDSTVNIEVLLKPIYYNFHTDINNHVYSCKNCKYFEDERFCNNKNSDKFNKNVSIYDTCLEGYRDMFLEANRI